jgi:hypothetical protein
VHLSTAFIENVIACSVTATGFEKWPNRPYIYGGGLDDSYELVQFHFHWSGHDFEGSEHTLGSLSYPLEVIHPFCSRQIQFVPIRQQ